MALASRPHPYRRNRNRNYSRENIDRFIPNRSAIDFDFAHYMLTSKTEFHPPTTVSSAAYRKQLDEVFNISQTRRILAFKNKAPTPPTIISVHPKTQRRYIPQTPQWKLNAPHIVDDYYLNILDWGSSNVLAIGLGNSVYLWDHHASDAAIPELLTVDEEIGPVTSVKWAPDGHRIAVGLNNSEVQLWDLIADRQIMTLRGCHSSRVGALDWNNQILTTGGMDGLIVNNDVRINDHIVQTYRGHHQEVCGLRWSASGQQLASGGNDNLLHIWDHRSTASSTQWLHRLQDHTAAVKALAWCPFQANLLASGGGGGDRCIKFWNTRTGACLNSVDTGSQVCSLLWSKNEHELLSSHGLPKNQLTLWKYPSMLKIAELTAHTSRVLFMSQSPDGCTVASAAAGDDETLRVWNVFGTPQVSKPPKAAPEPFAHFYRIRHPLRLPLRKREGGRLMTSKL